MHEWCGALVRLAWVTYPHAGQSPPPGSGGQTKASEPNRCGTVRVGDRLAAFLDETLLRWWRLHTLRNADVLDEFRNLPTPTCPLPTARLRHEGPLLRITRTLEAHRTSFSFLPPPHRKSPRVLAIFKAHEAQLRHIFHTYAQADKSLKPKQPGSKQKQGKGADNSINLRELLVMVKEGGLLDEELTVHNVTSIFNFVNSLSEEEGEDDQAMELDFDEMLQVNMTTARDHLTAPMSACTSKWTSRRRNGHDTTQAQMRSWAALQNLLPYPPSQCARLPFTCLSSTVAPP